MAKETKQEAETKTFTVDLYQSHWRRTKTETMTVQAKDQKDAEKQANAWVKDKGLKKDFDVEVSEVAPPELPGQVDETTPTE